MLKKIFLTFSIILYCLFILAQDSFSAISDFGLQQNQKALKISGAWSGVSIVAGTAGYLLSDDRHQKSMYLTNTAFGLFNGLVVFKGLKDLKKAQNENWSYAEALKNHRKIERLYVFNNGFNFAFIMGGAFLKEKSKSMSSKSKQDIFSGIGDGLIIQGIFFLIFDTLMYHKQKSFYDKKLSKFIPNDVSIGIQSISISWNLNSQKVTVE